MFIGVERHTGQVYEGNSAPQFPVWPRPAISMAKRIESPDGWNHLPSSICSTPFVWIFREESFDPVTRIRRGRLYEVYQATQPHTWPVQAHPTDYEGIRQVAAGGGLRKELYTYWQCQAISALPDSGRGATLALGMGRATSAWRVIQVETLVDDDVLVTLKALSAYALLPEINVAVIGEEHRQPVLRAVERVLDSAFRESPISVIDHCRNAAQVVLSRWLVHAGDGIDVLGKDLDQICRAVDRDPHRKHASRDAANIVRLLHSRGKANKQEVEGLRLATEEDAELSIQALGFLIREVGWAKQ